MLGEARRMHFSVFFPIVEYYPIFSLFFLTQSYCIAQDDLKFEICVSPHNLLPTHNILFHPYYIQLHAHTVHLVGNLGVLYSREEKVEFAI